jgi:hypothetical protein
MALLAPARDPHGRRPLETNFLGPPLDLAADAEVWVAANLD